MGFDFSSPMPITLIPAFLILKDSTEKSESDETIIMVFICSSVTAID